MFKGSNLVTIAQGPSLPPGETTSQILPSKIVIDRSSDLNKRHDLDKNQIAGKQNHHNFTYLLKSKESCFSWAQISGLF